MTQGFTCPPLSSGARYADMGHSMMLHEERKSWLGDVLQPGPVNSPGPRMSHMSVCSRADPHLNPWYSWSVEYNQNAKMKSDKIHNLKSSSSLNSSQPPGKSTWWSLLLFFIWWLLRYDKNGSTLLRYLCAVLPQISVYFSDLSQRRTLKRNYSYFFRKCKSRNYNRAS